ELRSEVERLRSVVKEYSQVIDYLSELKRK
ncbi:hypothetical protein LCGC14_3066230, partial [marine sediment metagenome]